MSRTKILVWYFISFIFGVAAYKVSSSEILGLVAGIVYFNMVLLLNITKK